MAGLCVGARLVPHLGIGSEDEVPERCRHSVTGAGLREVVDEMISSLQLAERAARLQVVNGVMREVIPDVPNHQAGEDTREEPGAEQGPQRQAHREGEHDRQRGGMTSRSGW